MVFRVGHARSQGPPFAQAVVDGVNTLEPWESASVDVTFDGSNVHFTFGIPRALSRTSSRTIMGDRVPSSLV
jgi:hypothetical protein